jgi:hypothetical protein
VVAVSLFDAFNNRLTHAGVCGAVTLQFSYGVGAHANTAGLRAVDVEVGVAAMDALQVRPSLSLSLSLSLSHTHTQSLLLSLSHAGRVPCTVRTTATSHYRWCDTHLVVRPPGVRRWGAFPLSSRPLSSVTRVW